MKKPLLIITNLTALFVTILGIFFHFFYELSKNNRFVGLFCPVNESVWEHMKLFFFPSLICYVILCFFKRDHEPCIVYSFPKAILLGTFSIPVLFYTYSGILGFTVTFIDITIFFISVIVAYTYLYKTTVSLKKMDDSLAWNLALIFMTFLFMSFSYNPPDLGIFKIPS